MPADITGTEIIEEDRATGHRAMQFIPGPIFANIVLADEPATLSEELFEEKQRLMANYYLLLQNFPEAKKQVDLAIYIFIGIVGCVVVFALGRIAWAWWAGP